MLSECSNDDDVGIGGERPVRPPVESGAVFSPSQVGHDLRAAQSVHDFGGGMEFSHDGPSTPNFLEPQEPNLIDRIQSAWSSPCGTMATSEKGGRDAPHAQRLRLLRRVMGYEHSARAWAESVGLSEQRYNNFENGTPLSKDAAFKLVAKVPGLTTDWLWFGRLDGLPYQLALKLAPEASGKANTTPSA